MSTENAPASDLVPLHTDLLLEVATALANDPPPRVGADQGCYLLTVLQLTLHAVLATEGDAGNELPSHHQEVRARLTSAAVTFALNMAKFAQRHFHTSRRGVECMEQAITVMDMVHRRPSCSSDLKVAILTSLGSHPCPSFTHLTISKELQARLHMLVFEGRSKLKGQGKLASSSASGHSDLKGDRKIPAMDLVLRDSLVSIQDVVSPYEQPPPRTRREHRGANAAPGPGQTNPFVVHRCGARLAELCIALLQSPESGVFSVRGGSGAEGSSNKTRKTSHSGRAVKKGPIPGEGSWDDEYIGQVLKDDASVSGLHSLLAFVGKLSLERWWCLCPVVAH